jgi:hypothetical protein
VTTVALWRMTSTAGGAAIFVALLRVRAAQASERARARTTERAAGGGRWALFRCVLAAGRQLVVRRSGGVTIDESLLAWKAVGSGTR